ncbi:amino acid transporter [Trypanosoma rangeli SC58]|uniref:Amino acid transporter n=1 Tax=Trypanosoma rangeli SC58 TaxID=429131 RepID=A0A061J3N6_TRYRA|nr:amino acid transporter [Trypanosoma rangeli SC58]
MASLSSIIPPGGMLSTVFNIASICVGAGILGLPAASNSSGVVMALVYPAIVGALSVYALYCLAAQMERFGLATYEGMARTLLGPGFDYFTAAVRSAITFGGCVAFIICVADIFRAIFKNADASGYWRSSSGTRLLTSLVWLVLMLPFVIPRRINSLRYVSTVGVVFIIYFVVMIIVHSGMNGLAENSKHITVAGRPTDDGVHMFGTGNKALDGLGVFMFAFTCQINAFADYWDMRERSVSRFTLYSAIAILLCFILYALTGIFGYFDFGSRATVSALLLYDPVKEPAVMMAYVGVLVKLCASYPIVIMVTRNSLYHSFGWNPDTLPFWRHCIFVISLAVASLLCGLFIPKINTVFGLIGAFCGGISGFILPALLMMYGGNWSLRSVGWMHYTLTYVLLLAGVAMMVFGTGATIYSAVKGD